MKDKNPDMEGELCKPSCFFQCQHILALSHLLR